MPTLRVVSYNVHTLRDDLDALTEVVGALEPDIVIIQEAPRRFRWRTRCATLAHRFGLFYASGGLPALGNLIMTSQRVRLHDAWALRYPLKPGRHLRGAAFARCSVDRVPFVVVGSHLATDPAERPTQAQALKATLAELAAPAILGVDFNETPDGAGWRHLAEGLTDAATARRGPTPGDAALGDAALGDTASGDSAPGGSVPGGTFPVPNADRRIDGILVDPRLAVTGYRVVDSAAARRASDHFPIMVDLALPHPVRAEPDLADQQPAVR